MNTKKISWWNIELGEEEIQRVTTSLKNRKIGQGAVTEEFENRLAEMLKVPHVVCTTSGTAALMMAYMASGVGCGDEVVVPNKTFIATAHAAMILGARVKLIDIHKDSLLADVSLLEKAMTKRTKVACLVHLNGRCADIKSAQKICGKHGAVVIEDAAQAFLSCYENHYLGTMGRFGCFSLGVAKMITTGQGGFVCCQTKEDCITLKKIRNQGVLELKKGWKYSQLAGNFKFNDILASIGLAQLDKVAVKRQRMLDIYKAYQQGLKDAPCLRLVSAEIDKGEIPLRMLALCREKQKFIEALAGEGIEVVADDPCLSEAEHIPGEGTLEHSQEISGHLLILPSGPDQPLDNVEQTIQAIQQIKNQFVPWGNA